LVPQVGESFQQLLTRGQPGDMLVIMPGGKLYTVFESYGHWLHMEMSGLQLHGFFKICIFVVLNSRQNTVRYRPHRVSLSIIRKARPSLESLDEFCDVYRMELKRAVPRCT
jgi:hypothetical protein